MSNTQTPLNNPTATDRALQFGQLAIATHPSVTTVRAQRQGQLLNAISLLMMVMSLSGLLTSPDDITPFIFMLAVSIGAFALGKSKYPEIGTFLFSFGFLSTAYLPLYAGPANNYLTLVLSVVPVALIAASVMLNQRVFAALVVYAIAATFLPPLYAPSAIPSNEILRTGGIVTAMGIVLYGINYFRAHLEDSRLLEVNAANQQLQVAKAELEAQAKAYTQEIENTRQQVQQQAARLHVTAEVSQDILSNINMPLEELLASVCEIISEKLGFYHVGIFLVDKKRQYAELFATNSAGGQRMLERRHQLKVGGSGIVGYVAQSGFPRIALSTGADAVFFNNPDLPDTRSEMALPLMVGNLVIGVLDVQSALPAAFSDEDASTFKTLANQIALTVKNAQGADLPRSQRAEGRKDAALETGKGRQIGYSYLADGTIASAKPINTPALEKALKLSETVAMPASAGAPLPNLAVPVKIRDNVVGYIHLESGDVGKKWTEDDILIVQSVSERAALALENARLFEETERRAEQEQVMAQVTARIGESNSFENILQTTIREIGQTLKAKRAYIQMEVVAANPDNTAAEQGN
jgi:GAF domain-containing protein